MVPERTKPILRELVLCCQFPLWPLVGLLSAAKGPRTMSIAALFLYWSLWCHFHCLILFDGLIKNDLTRSTSPPFLQSINPSSGFSLACFCDSVLSKI